MIRRLPFLIGAFVLLAFLAFNTIFIVDEREKAMVLQFGQVRSIKEEPGLGLKIPFVQNVVFYDSRIQGIETASLEVTPLDDRRLIVDAFARWRISDVAQFRRAVGAGGMQVASQRLEAIMTANVREVLGSVRSEAVLSADRVGLMNQIRDNAIVEARALGVDVIDVRLKRADLPEQNLAATFDRMQAERQREAADERARGNEAAQRLRAQADRTAIEIVSEAERDANIIRGEADAERNAILAGSFSENEEFFAFLRSMQAYRNSLTGENTTLMLEPDSAFFNYLRSPNSASAGAASPDAEPEAAPAANGSAAAPAPSPELVGPAAGSTAALPAPAAAPASDASVGLSD